MELIYNKSKPVAVTCMGFPAGDVNNFAVGCEEGTVYTASRHGRSVVPGSKCLMDLKKSLLKNLMDTPMHIM